jgi:hypothetical protein
LLATADRARRRFHIGGWVFGGWIGLVVGLKLLGLAAPRQRHDFEPDRSGCFGCARCFAFCPQEQVRMGTIKFPGDAMPDAPEAAAPVTGRAARETVVKT